MTSDPDQFSIVANAAGSVSVWPAGEPLPDGWRAAGPSGSLAECREWIDQHATLAPAPVPGVGSATLVSMFAATVARHPQRPAVNDGTRRYSYAELDARAEELARRLRDRGIGREDRVVCYLDRGAPMFVAMLGILKAGAAYVPTDTRYPDGRRDQLITQSRPAALITSPERAGQLASLEVERIELDGDGQQPARVEVAVEAGPRPEDAAAVLFTSGSSGEPKAVVLQHGNLVSFAGDAALPELEPGDRVAQVSSVSFDAFHFETWCTLAAGAEIVVLPAMPDLIGGDIRRELKRRQITAMLAPTMAVNHVLREDRDTFGMLRILHTGGDVLAPAACRELLDSGYQGEFYNLYGPTEGTTACTAHPVTKADLAADTVPIGTELAGSAIYLLDAALREVPAGTVGELHIGGSGVTRGYLDQPGLTAERFRPDPFAGAGSRMYATGDLAMRREDGVLEYHGRIDDQVKIRGHRVEPGEVERILGRHPEVREVAVLVTGEGQDKHLVALVGHYGRVTPRELRDHAVERMPEFMVPSSFVLVDGIPANDHGKRDVARLRELADEHLRRRDSLVAPGDEIERYLVELWEDLLAVERIGTTDDFFSLGGNSLQAFRVQRRISRELDVQLEPKDVLANSELRALATLIRGRKGSVTP
ncbi:amino acid adenylation domain-containing protein [Amycolatopsis aidingensis]|uniref:amino acid adenylation domain-containing protein n=1 Tax=Amycolatopsis aidingensis TaxID=2842453 RepID=UPI001C0BE159|nr:amino acid adenylation domain-containing protein [Amycolatopsis aidingensis]